MTEDKTVLENVQEAVADTLRRKVRFDEISEALADRPHRLVMLGHAREERHSYDEVAVAL